MSYVTKKMVDHMIDRMVHLEKDLNEVYTNNGLDFRSNSGRRNAILSQAQEVFLAESLNLYGESALEDGRTGYPDICVVSQNRELECKITSGSGGSWTLQADYETLDRKGEVDFLYVLVNEEFNEFAVLFFDGLTKDDFHPPSSGSRGKSPMNKINAMDKCTVLMGRVEAKNDKLIDQYSDKIIEIMKKYSEKLSLIDKRISETTTPKKLEALVGGKEGFLNRSANKLEKIAGKIVYWRNAPLQFSIELEKRTDNA